MDEAEGMEQGRAKERNRKKKMNEQSRYVDPVALAI